MTPTACIMPHDVLCMAHTGTWCRCNAGVNFMLDYDKAGAFRLAALQSPAGGAGGGGERRGWPANWAGWGGGGGEKGEGAEWPCFLL